MEFRSRVAIISRTFSTQGSMNIIISVRNFVDNIVYSMDVLCDENLICVNGMTFTQAVLTTLARDWNSILPELSSLAATSHLYLQVATKGSNYIHPIPVDYYRQDDKGLFGGVFAKMLGSTAPTKVPTVTDECAKELGIDKFSRFMFLVNNYNNPDLISEVESSRLDYQFISDNLKTIVLSKAWLEYLHAIITNQDKSSKVPILTYCIPDEQVEECLSFCMRRGYDRIVWMFVQEHPVRLSQKLINDVTDYHNQRKG